MLTTDLHTETKGLLPKLSLFVSFVVIVTTGFLTGYRLVSLLPAGSY